MLLWVVPSEWELSFNGDRLSVLQDKKSSGDWLHNNVNLVNPTELYT